MNPHLGVAMRSDEDDRYWASLGLKPYLQFKTGHARHTNVADQAGGLGSGSRIQELFCGAEAERGQPVRLDQVSQRTLKRLIVVNDCYEFWALPDAHWAKRSAITKRAQSGLSRANYYLGGSRLEVERGGIAGE
jgi:hypothetical protein